MQLEKHFEIDFLYTFLSYLKSIIIFDGNVVSEVVGKIFEILLSLFFNDFGNFVSNKNS